MDCRWARDVPASQAQSMTVYGGLRRPAVEFRRNSHGRPAVVLVSEESRHKTPAAPTMIARLDRLATTPGCVPVPDRGAGRGCSTTSPRMSSRQLDEAEFARRSRSDRDRGRRGGSPVRPGPADQLLLAVVWLRVYPTHAVLARTCSGCPSRPPGGPSGGSWAVLAAAGRDTMRMPDPGEHARRDLPAVLTEAPGLAVLVDTFEQPTHRPKTHAGGRTTRGRRSGTRSRVNSPWTRSPGGWSTSPRAFRGRPRT